MGARLFLGVAVSLLAACVLVTAQTDALKIEQVMSPQELWDAGINGLTSPQRQALDAWLNRYTVRVLQVALRTDPPKPSARPGQPAPSPRSFCSPAIESAISGAVHGWNGETVFKLDNGQIWQQAEYDYTYFYEYHPDVTIYQTGAGCRMKVEDESETILVKRIK
jgi:hypothetical protein